MMGSDTELQQLASICGIMTSYEDVFQKRHVVPMDSLFALLNAMDVEVSKLEDVPAALERERLVRFERGLEPVIVVWQGDPIDFDVTVPWQSRTSRLECTVELEGGSDRWKRQFDLSQVAPLASSCGRYATLRTRMPLELTSGYHRLTVEVAGQTYESLVISAPRRAYAAEPAGRRDWGCFLPLYALQSDRNWGAGDFQDLRNLVDWTADLGGTIVGTLPLLAAFLDEPCEPSPYAPASRLAWNEFYIDVMAIPELADNSQAAAFLESAGFLHDVVDLRKSDQVEYRRIMALKRHVLEILSDDFFQRKPPRRYAEFQRFLDQHPHMEDYASFRATHERRREPWDRWPQPLRDGHLTDQDYDPRQKQYHLYVQWISTTQLESLADAAGGGLYLDLPLGVRPDGYDTFRWRDVYACRASAGSPPDAMWTQGQDWSFPPLHPERIRRDGYRHVRDFLGHHLRLARMLRVDHVMQLHRLFWIPRGMRVAQGTYVCYHPEEFYAILNLESHRCRTTLIGENLGTVPREVNDAMRQHGFHQMYVLQYEIAAPEEREDSLATQTGADSDSGSPSPLPTSSTACSAATLNEVPAGSLASLNTHDMPTFAAWWRGTDISLREQIGLINEKLAARESDVLRSRKADLVAWLRTHGWLTHDESDDRGILRAFLKFLARSDANAVLVNLEDVWLETLPQNVPGTAQELPNWKRKAAVKFDGFADCPDIVDLFREINQLR